MLFNSSIYILFLSAVIILYWNAPQKYRIPLLLVASYIFYMSWRPPFGLIYGPLIFLDSAYFYGLSVFMVKKPAYKKWILVFGIVTELLVLGFFKYANFISLSIEKLCHVLQIPFVHYEFHIFLPLAISFTNFILISYLVDIYRGDEKPDPSFTRFATYVAFFPHLIAGPIVRAKELLHQIDLKPSFQWNNLISGIQIFIYGLGIKVLIADAVAPFVNHIYHDPSLQSFGTSWMATYGFAIQIFCDFAGYTMMAQGSALMLGYTLPENFNYPYLSINITDFWRRWHMSLSRWLRDYLYIPLGGSRCSRVRTYFNLFVTMGLGGLWHGASWTFVIWGIYQGLLLSLHKLFTYFKVNQLVPKLLAWFITFHAVCIGWVFFRAGSLPQAINILKTMFTPFTSVSLPATLHEEKGIALLSIACFVIIQLFSYFIYPKLAKSPWVIAPLQGFVYSIIFYLLITCNSNSQQFIYFQF